jgi:hypothetical protein
MGRIQRTLIRDEGERVVIRHNHYLGLVFVAFAAIPLLVPFKSTSSQAGLWITSGGGLVFAALGLYYFLQRRELVLDLRAGRCAFTSGTWPTLRTLRGELTRIQDVRVEERTTGRGLRLRPATTFEVRFAIQGVLEPFTFLETSDASEALDLQRHWRTRLVEAGRRAA